MLVADRTERVGVWSLRWSNPYKPRPEGFPEIMLRIENPLAKGEGAGQCPQEMHEAWEEMRSYGYCVSWHSEGPPARQLPLESKQRIRRRNLWKRLFNRYPMFVETWYREAVEAREEYYGTYRAGEWADVAFAKTTMGNLKTLKEATL